MMTENIDKQDCGRYENQPGQAAYLVSCPLKNAGTLANVKLKS